MPHRHEGCSSSILDQARLQHTALPVWISIALLICGSESHLRAWEVMVFGKCRGVLVQPWLAILSGIVWQMGKVQEPWLFRLVLLLLIGRVHDVKLGSEGDV